MGENNLQNAGQEVVEVIFRISAQCGRRGGWGGSERAIEGPGKSGARAAGWNDAADHESGGWMGIRRLRVMGVGIRVHRGEVSGPRRGKCRQHGPIRMLENLEERERRKLVSIAQHMPHFPFP